MKAPFHARKRRGLKQALHNVNMFGQVKSAASSGKIEADTGEWFADFFSSLIRHCSQRSPIFPRPLTAQWGTVSCWI